MAKEMKETVAEASCFVDRDELINLRLSESDMQALARQGFISAEYRQQRGPYYKLR